MKQVKAPCSECVRETTHNVVHEIRRTTDDFLVTFALLQCAGCQSVSLREQTRFSGEDEAENAYYPSPVTRKAPAWVMTLVDGVNFGKDEETLGELLIEVYQATAGNQHRLAAMGIRALLEHVMITKIGDIGSFDKKLDEFQKRGFISVVQRGAMRAILDVGDAAMHRGFRPTDLELGKALDIVEGVFAAIYDHSPAAGVVTSRVPPRAPRPTKP